jgi:hypothetical protein
MVTSVRQKATKEERVVEGLCAEGFSSFMGSQRNIRENLYLLAIGAVALDSYPFTLRIYLSEC